MAPTEAGAPTIRDTGISVSDVTFALGPEQLSDGEVLERFGILQQADLSNVVDGVEFVKADDQGVCPGHLVSEGGLELRYVEVASSVV